MTPVLLIIVFVLILYNAYVSRRVTRDDGLSRGQIAAQLGVVWLLPFAGAILVHWILAAQSRQRDTPSGKYAAYEDYSDHQISPKIYDDH